MTFSLHCSVLTCLLMSSCSEPKPSACTPLPICGIVDSCGGDDWPTSCESLSVELLRDDYRLFDDISDAVVARVQVDEEGRFCLSTDQPGVYFVALRWSDEPECASEFGEQPGGQLSAQVDACDPPEDVVLSPACETPPDYL
jgi:hypothetical protein